VAALLIMDHVLIRVAVGREARRGSEEVLKGDDVDRRVKYWKRERSGRRRGGGSDDGDGCGDDGRGDVLDGDVFK